MRRGLRRGLTGLLALLALFAAAVVLTARAGDPALFPGGPDGIDVVLVSNGYHSGLALPRRQLAELAGTRGLPALVSVMSRFRHYDWIEFGWGDAEFYRSTPTVASFQWRLALRALAGQGQGTALHVVGLATDPEVGFSGAYLVRIRLSPEGFGRMASRIDRSFDLGPNRQPEEMGPGLYGPSLFYKAQGRFHLFRVCNHWIADLLDAAGVPTAPLAALLPAGLVADLKWRSGLAPAP